MTRDELFASLAAWIGEITEGPAPELSDATHLVLDLGLDSLALAELAAKLRMRYSIRLRPNELRQDLHAGALVDTVLARMSA